MQDLICKITKAKRAGGLVQVVVFLSSKCKFKLQYCKQIKNQSNQHPLCIGHFQGLDTFSSLYLVVVITITRLVDFHATL
jgi:hypothetical protein